MKIKKSYEKKMVYRVWYGDGMGKEAFFTEKETAEGFVRLVNGRMNQYKWEMQIEE